MAQKKERGRPKEYNKDTIKRICKLIMEGNTITEVARKLGVTRQAIYLWKKKDEEFNNLYEEALRFKAELYMDEILEISNDESRDILIDPETGKQCGNNTAVQRDKLKIAARTKLMQWIDPKKYSIQNIDITTNGENVYGGLIITPPKEKKENDE